jgi:hypothetical protein
VLQILRAPRQKAISDFFPAVDLYGHRTILKRGTPVARQSIVPTKADIGGSAKPGKRFSAESENTEPLPSLHHL